MSKNLSGLDGVSCMNCTVFLRSIPEKLLNIESKTNIRWFQSFVNNMIEKSGGECKLNPNISAAQRYKRTNDFCSQGVSKETGKKFIQIITDSNGIN